MSPNNKSQPALPVSATLAKWVYLAACAYCVLAFVLSYLFGGAKVLPSALLGVIGTVILALIVVWEVNLLSRARELTMGIALLSFFTKIVVVMATGAFVKFLPQTFNKVAILVLGGGILVVILAEILAIIQHRPSNFGHPGATVAARETKLPNGGAE